MHRFRNVIAAFALLIVIIVAGQICSVSAQEEQGILKVEKIGPLACGLQATEVEQLLGQPNKQKVTAESRDQRGFWECQSGETGWNQVTKELGSPFEVWAYPDKGILLKIGSSQNGVRTVFDVTVSAPCQYQTLKKVGIGSTYTQVTNAYASSQWKTILRNQEKIVVGTSYESLTFSFKDGKVTKIVLGASAKPSVVR